jgi:hypothetical protein
MYVLKRQRDIGHEKKRDYVDCPLPKCQVTHPARRNAITIISQPFGTT